MYLFLVDGNSEHKKAKGVNKEKITHSEYKYIFFNQKFDEQN